MLTACSSTPPVSYRTVEVDRDRLVPIDSDLLSPGNYPPHPGDNATYGDNMSWCSAVVIEATQCELDKSSIRQSQQDAIREQKNRQEKDDQEKEEGGQ